MDTENENENEALSEDEDMRSDFASAIESLESEAAESDSSESGLGTLPAPEAGSEKRESGESPKTEIETPEAKPVEKAADSSVAPDGTKEPTTPDKVAPVGWKPDARETWANVPKAAQTAILGREREINVLLQQTVSERRTASQFAKTMQPFQQQLQAAGYGDPFTAVQSVLSDAAAVRTGTMEQRATAAATMIKNLGIDIGELDKAIVAGGQAAPRVNAEMEEMLNRRLAPIDALMNQQQQSQDQQDYSRKQVAAGDVAAFSETAEFINDVRLDMADLMDLATNRGQQLTMPQAYEKACLLNPQVAAVIKQREGAASVNDRNSSLARKRVAASSVSGNPAGGGAAPRMDTVEDAINAAWDSVAR
jgi:hypothetical protein